MEIKNLLIILLLLIGFLIIFYRFSLIENFSTKIEDMIDCYVITLKREDRLKNIEDQQKKTKIKINLYDAFDGRNFKSTNFKNELKDKGNLDESGPNFNKTEKNRNNEIGCCLSHIGIYNMIKEKKKNPNYKKKYTLVLEDDVNLDNEFDIKFEKGFELIKDTPFDILYLGRLWSKPGEKVNDFIHKFKNGPIYGTHAYLINNDSIDKLVESTNVINNPIDWMLSFLIGTKKLEMYYFYPCIATQNGFKSTIHEDFYFLK